MNIFLEDIIDTEIPYENTEYSDAISDIDGYTYSKNKSKLKKMMMNVKDNEKGFSLAGV